MQQILITLTILASFFVVYSDAYLQPGDKLHCTEPNGTSISPSKFVNIDIGRTKCIKCTCENGDVKCNLAADCNPSQQQAPPDNNNDQESAQTQMEPTETPATITARPVTTTTSPPMTKDQTKKPIIGMRITLSPTPKPRPSTTEEPFQYADELEEEPADTDIEDVEEKPAEEEMQIVPVRPSTTTTTTTLQPPKRQPAGPRYNFVHQTQSTSTQAPTRAPTPRLVLSSSQPHQIPSRSSSQLASRISGSQRVSSPAIAPRDAPGFSRPPTQSRLPIPATTPQPRVIAASPTLDIQDEEPKSLKELGAVNRPTETYKNADHLEDLFYNHKTPAASKESMQDVSAEPVTDEISGIANWGKDNVFNILMLFAVAAVLTSFSFVLCSIVYCAVQIFGKNKKQQTKPVQAIPKAPLSSVTRTLDYNFDF